VQQFYSVQYSSKKQQRIFKFFPKVEIKSRQQNTDYFKITITSIVLIKALQEYLLVSFGSSVLGHNWGGLMRSWILNSGLGLIEHLIDTVHEVRACLRSHVAHGIPDEQTEGGTLILNDWMMVLGAVLSQQD
jgi:hypothetical protein